jgi:hypothetical protein
MGCWRALPHTGPADEVAPIAARYLPAPLYQQLPAHPTPSNTPTPPPAAPHLLGDGAIDVQFGR